MELDEVDLLQGPCMRIDDVTSFARQPGLLSTLLTSLLVWMIHGGKVSNTTAVAQLEPSHGPTLDLN